MTITLDTVLTPANLNRVWKAIRTRERKVHLNEAPLVRDSTGGIALDLNRSKNLDYIRTCITEGTYRPQVPLVIESAKSTLLRRRLSFLTIEDSLVFGSLVQAIRPSLMSNMPTWVRFGRADSQSTNQKNTTPSFDYEDWWAKWLRYRNLLNLIEGDVHPLLLTSDIVNFYESVDLSLLRSKVTRVTNLEERANDLLFYLLDRLLPNFDYGPKGLYGLPVVGEDTSRILAHYFLLDLDLALSQEGDEGRYTRWVDDMAISVPNHIEGVKVVSKIENALSGIGLVANASKTEIISKEEFRARHYVAHNEFLDNIHEATQSNLSIDKRQFHESLQQFSVSKEGGNKSQVLRRYYTQARRIRSRIFLSKWVEHINQFPTNAQSILDHVSFFGGNLDFCIRLFDYIKTHGSLFEDLQILLYETLLLKPFPNDRILRSLVVHQTYQHSLGFGDYTRPNGYVRGLQSLVMYKFGGVKVAKLVAKHFAKEAVESPTYATYAFLVVATDVNLRHSAYEDIEHVLDPRLLRLRTLVEQLESGDQQAIGMLIGLLDPKETKYPSRYVVNSRALPLLEIARGASTSATNRLMTPVANTIRKLRIADGADLIDEIAISHL